MYDHGLPALFAVFVWWFSTGAIIYLNHLPRHTLRWSMGGATVLCALCLYGLAETAGDDGVSAVYLAFVFGLLAWGWHELSFFMGYVTGPRRTACPVGLRGWRRFVCAMQAVLYHELAIAATAVGIVAMTWGQPNQFGTWTFLVLWWMRQNAKLNVFLGVRNLSEEFVPDHLGYLKSFMARKPMNLLFPVSVTVSTVIAVILVDRAVDPAASAFQAVGYTFLSVLMVLAILEHWFMVLPLPAAALWHWGLSSRRGRDRTGSDTTSGAGRTAPSQTIGDAARGPVLQATGAVTQTRQDHIRPTAAVRFAAAATGME